MALTSGTRFGSEVSAGAEFRASAPRPLLTLPRGTVFAYPTPDLQRLLAAVPDVENTTSSLTLVFDWTGALGR